MTVNWRYEYVTSTAALAMSVVALGVSVLTFRKSGRVAAVKLSNAWVVGDGAERPRFEMGGCVCIDDEDWLPWTQLERLGLQPLIAVEIESTGRQPIYIKDVAFEFQGGGLLYLPEIDASARTAKVEHGDWAVRYFVPPSREQLGAAVLSQRITVGWFRAAVQIGTLGKVFSEKVTICPGTHSDFHSAHHSRDAVAIASPDISDAT